MLLSSRISLIIVILPSASSAVGMCFAYHHDTKSRGNKHCCRTDRHRWIRRNGIVSDLFSHLVGTNNHAYIYI